MVLEQVWGKVDRKRAAQAPGCYKQMGRSKGMGTGPPSLPLYSILGFGVAGSLLLAPLTPLKLAKPAVCQACPAPARDTYSSSQPSQAGERGFQRAPQAQQR